MARTGTTRHSRGGKAQHMKDQQEMRTKTVATDWSIAGMQPGTGSSGGRVPVPQTGSSEAGLGRTQEAP